MYVNPHYDLIVGLSWELNINYGGELLYLTQPGVLDAASKYKFSLLMS